MLVNVVASTSTSQLRQLLKTCARNPTSSIFFLRPKTSTHFDFLRVRCKHAAAKQAAQQIRRKSTKTATNSQQVVVQQVHGDVESSEQIQRIVTPFKMSVQPALRTPSRQIEQSLAL